jgi:hypothetical protein
MLPVTEKVIEKADVVGTSYPYIYCKNRPESVNI